MSPGLVCSLCWGCCTVPSRMSHALKLFSLLIQRQAARSRLVGRTLAAPWSGALWLLARTCTEEAERDLCAVADGPEAGSRPRARQYADRLNRGALDLPLTLPEQWSVWHREPNTSRVSDSDVDRTPRALPCVCLRTRDDIMVVSACWRRFSACWARQRRYLLRGREHRRKPRALACSMQGKTSIAQPGDEALCVSRVQLQRFRNEIVRCSPNVLIDDEVESLPVSHKLVQLGNFS